MRLIDATRSVRTVCCALSAAAIVGGCSGGDSTASEPVTGIRFVSQPASTLAGQAFTVSVELIGASGTRVNSADDQVTISATGGVTLTGSTTVAAASGLATFSDLKVNSTATSVQLQASANGLTASSAAFDVTAGPPTLAQSTVSPAPGNIQPGELTAFTFTFKDVVGNPVANAAVSLSTNLAGATFTPSSGTTSATGSFSSTLRAPSTGSASITATVNGTVIAFATPYVVVDMCPPAAMTFPGTVNGTLPTGPCVGGGVPAAVFRFTTAANGGAGFTVTAAFAPLFEIRSDPPVDNVALTLAAGAAPEWLLPAGTFQARIRASTGGGAFSITGAVVPANTGQVLRHLAVAGTFAQNMEESDIAFGDGTFVDVFVINSLRPCTITMRASGLDAYLEIYDIITQDFLTFDDDGGGGTDAMVTRPACTNGGNPILIATEHLDPLAAGAVVPYTLTIAFTGTAALRADERPSVSVYQRIPAASELGRRIRASASARGKGK